jgi:hypothetical protein
MDPHPASVKIETYGRIQFMINQILGALWVYILIGFCLAIGLIGIDPRNKKGRIVQTKNNWLRLLWITCLWMLGWNRAKRSK